MRIIFLIIVGVTSLMSSNFNRINDIVIDNITGLEWQDNNETNVTSYTWMDAINYCESLNLNNKDDWRLPNINELFSIIDESAYNPSIDNIFHYISSEYYWSSTVSTFNLEKVWLIYFQIGNRAYLSKSDTHLLRCVRGE